MWSLPLLFKDSVLKIAWFFVALVKWILLALLILLSFGVVSMLLGLYYALTEPFALMDPIEVQKLSRPTELILYFILFLFWLRVTQVYRFAGIARDHTGRDWIWIEERSSLSGSRVANDQHHSQAEPLPGAEDPRPFVNGYSSSELPAKNDREHTPGAEDPDPFVDGSSPSAPSTWNDNEYSPGTEDYGPFVDGSSSSEPPTQNDKQSSSPGRNCAFELDTLSDFHIDLPEYSTPHAKWVSNPHDALAQELTRSRI